MARIQHGDEMHRDAGGGGSGPFEQEASPNEHIWSLITGATTLADSASGDALLILDTGQAFLGGGVGADSTSLILDSAQVTLDAGAGTSGKHWLTGGVGIVIPVLSADPAGGDSENGQIYYNDSDEKFRIYENGAWTDMVGTGTGNGRVITTTRSMVQSECWSSTTLLDGGVFFTNSGSGAAGSTVTGEVDHPGIVAVNTGTTTTGRSVLITSASVSGIVLDAGLNIRFGMIGRVPTVSDATDRFQHRTGLGDSGGASEHTDGVYFRHADNVNSDKYEAVCRANGVETAVDTGIAGDTAWHLFEIVLSGVTSAEFLIDGASVATITTNIPSGTGRELALNPAGIVKSAGTTSRAFYVDAFWYEFDFASARA